MAGRGECIMNKKLINSFAKRKSKQNRNEMFNNMWRRTPPEALEYFNKKQNKIKITGSWRQLSSAEHNRCFTIANVTNAELLQTVLNNLIKCKKEGKSIKEFKENVTDAVVQNGWLYDPVTNPKGFQASRLATIYNTNMNVSYTQGEYNQSTAMAEYTGNVYWQYKQVERPTKRDEHEQWADKVFRYDDPIWNTIYPPSGFNCGCTVIGLNYEDVKLNRLNIETGTEYDVLPDEDYPIQISSKYSPQLERFNDKLAGLVNNAINTNSTNFDKYEFTDDPIEKTVYINRQVKNNYSKLSNETKLIVDNIDELNMNIVFDDANEKVVKETQKQIKENNIKVNRKFLFFYGECYGKDKMPKHCLDIINGKKEIRFDTFINLSLSRQYSYKENLFYPYKTKDDEDDLIRFFYEFYINEKENYLPNKNNNLILNNYNTFRIFDNIKTNNVYLIRLRK